MKKKYRVILMNNGKYKKTLHRCDTRKTAFIAYNKLVKENKKDIVFPRRFVTLEKITPVEYHIVIIKAFWDESERQLIDNGFGEMVPIPLIGDWLPIISTNYDVEETFWVYDRSPIHERVLFNDICEIMKNLMNKQSRTLTFMVVHNKVVAYDDEVFQMIVCKNPEDGRRLHHKLSKALRDEERMYFMGAVDSSNITMAYDLIYERSGWTMSKIYKKTTRN